MSTQTSSDISNVIAFVPRASQAAVNRRGGSVVLPFDAKRHAPAAAPVVDIDGWYHQAEIDAARPH